MLALQETWLRDADRISDITDCFSHKSKFRFFSAHRLHQNKDMNRGSGGVGLLISSDFWDSAEQVMKSSAEYETVWIKVKKANTVLHIASVYLPPQTFRRSRAAVNESLDRLCHDIKTLSTTAPCIVCGDFNMRVSTLPSTVSSTVYSRLSQDSLHVPTAAERDFINSFNICNLLLLNGLFGRTAQFTNIRVAQTASSAIAASVVDYIAVDHSLINCVNQQRGVKVEHNYSLSPEHALITVAFNIACPTVNSNDNSHSQVRTSRVQKQVFTFSKVSQAAYFKSINSFINKHASLSTTNGLSHHLLSTTLYCHKHNV